MNNLFLLDVPRDWIVSELREYLSFISYGFTNPMPDSVVGPYMVTAKDIKDLKVNYTIARKTTREAFKDLLSDKSRPKLGDLLLTKDGTLGRVAIVDRENICINQSVAVLRANERIDSKFLLQLLASPMYQQMMLDNAGGSTIKHIYITIVDKMNIAVPSYKEQQKIAAILTSVDDVIEKTQAQINKLKDLKIGMMQELLTCGVGVDGKPHVEFKDSPVGRIPKGWDVVPLTNFALNQKQSFVNGPFGSDLLSSELTNQGVPVIYVRDMKNKEYKHISKVYVTEEKANNLSACNIIFGDVLVAKVGDPPCNSGVYRSAFRAVVTQDVIRIRPSEVVDSNFLAYLLNSSIGRKQIEKIEIAGTRKRVSLTEFKKLLFPMPTLEEQKMIGSSLQSFDEKLEQLYKKLEKVNYTKKALMQDLLTGKVRVKVD